MEENVIFANVGWMQFYQSSITGEPDPVGGGKYTRDHLGTEKDNFLINSDGYVRAYFAMARGTDKLNLFRVEGKIESGAAEKISDILVIFVAHHPKRRDLDGPAVVGWFRNATLYREVQTSVYGNRKFRVETLSANLHFIHAISIPRAKPGITGRIGQMNIYYTRDSEGKDGNYRGLRIELEIGGVRRYH